jgi:hypothetical protein
MQPLQYGLQQNQGFGFNPAAMQQNPFYYGQNPYSFGGLGLSGGN